MKRALVMIVMGCGSTASAPVEPAPKADAAVKEAKFRGAIIDGTFECAAGGRCEIRVQTPEGPRRVVIRAGREATWGQAWDLGAFVAKTRTDFVGVEVEVFGAVTDEVSLEGNGAYYVRMATPPWPVPDGWGREQILFPLEFAPSLNHRGMEELRFSPGFLKAGSPNRWSYAFQWDLTDAAELDAAALAAELTAYFRGLLVEVDGDRKRFDPSAIAVTAQEVGDAFSVTAHLFDAFGDGTAIDLEGTAKRSVCGARVVWRFVMAPATSPIRKALDELAASAPCGS